MNLIGYVLVLLSFEASLARSNFKFRRRDRDEAFESFFDGEKSASTILCVYCYQHRPFLKEKCKIIIVYHLLYMEKEKNNTNHLRRW